jgi:hypothetical protein
MPHYIWVFNCFMVVSVIGYTGLYRTPLSQVAIIAFIMISIILIPMQINELSVLLSAHSIYRDPYNPNAMQYDTHIIVCGYIKNWRRIEKLLKELLHPNRLTDSYGTLCNVVILSPLEPSDGMKALLWSSKFDGVVRYVVGSVLTPTDLMKARADIASGIIFLCNIETTDEDVDTKGDALSASFRRTEESASILLQTLAITNYNSDVNLLVQVFNTEDRDILKDSAISGVLCLNEYKTIVQARNCTCPGFAPLIENLFRTFKPCASADLRYLSRKSARSEDNLTGDMGGAYVSKPAPTRPKYLKSMKRRAVGKKDIDPWIAEYAAGAALQPYFIPLSHAYLTAFSFEWTLISEGIYLEFDYMLIGVACPQDDTVIINPCSSETMALFKYASKFYNRYSVGVVLCDSQETANIIAFSIADVDVIGKIATKIIIAEETLRVRYRATSRNKANVGGNRNTRLGGAGTVQRASMVRLDDPGLASSGGSTDMKRRAQLKEIIRITKSRSVTAGELSQNSVNALESHSSIINMHDSVEEEFKGYVVRPPSGTPMNRGSSSGAMSRSNSNGLRSSPSPSSTTTAGKYESSAVASKSPSSTMMATKRGRRGGATASPPTTMMPPSGWMVKGGAEASAQPTSSVTGPVNSLKQVRQSFRNSISLIVKSNEELDKAKLSDEEEDDDSGGKPAAAPLLRKKRSIINDLLNDNKLGAHNTGTNKLRHQESFNTGRSFRRRLNTGEDSFNDRNSEILTRLRENFEQREAFANDLKVLAGADAVTFDKESMELASANKLSHHIVVFGCMDNIAVFINELRKPLVVNEAYHSIVIVNETEPESWLDISDLHHDVYFIRATLINPDGFNRANISKAFALCMLASKASVTQVEGEDLDSEALFAYLKLEKHLPQHLFFTTELTIANNMAVLNTTLLSRARGTEDYGLVRVSSQTNGLVSRRASIFAQNGDGEDAVMTPKARRLSNASLLFNSDATQAELKATADAMGSAPKNGSKGGHKTLLKSFNTQNASSSHLSMEDCSHGAFCSYRRRLPVNGKSTTVNRSSWHGAVGKGTAKVVPLDSGERRIMLRLGWGGRRKQKGINSHHAQAASRGHTQREKLKSDSAHDKQKLMSRLFWTIADTHHALPVFACGRAFASTSFDSVLCQVRTVIMYFY